MHQNTIRIRRRRLGDLRSIRGHGDFHHYLITSAIDEYFQIRAEGQQSPGSVLALCANEREATTLRAYPFEQITLAGLLPCSSHIQQEIQSDPRLTYEIQNSERLSFEPRSYDLVLCKEGLHHLARPVDGLYEMLRITRGVAIFIEPYQTRLSIFLEWLGLASTYERGQSGNIASRDNFVFRWDKELLRRILNSYYLDSGYQVYLTVGWMTSKFNGHSNTVVRFFASTVGWLMSHVPFASGNYVTAVIVPGSDLPSD